MYHALNRSLTGTHPSQILNSDLGFALLYANNVSESILQATVEALQPYPRGKLESAPMTSAWSMAHCVSGLLTNVGMVVANAAYDSNRTNIQVRLSLATRLSSTADTLRRSSAISRTMEQSHGHGNRA